MEEDRSLLLLSPVEVDFSLDADDLLRLEDLDFFVFLLLEGLFSDVASGDELIVSAVVSVELGGLLESSDDTEGRLGSRWCCLFGGLYGD